MCGECCKILPIVAVPTKESIEYYLARGIVWDRAQGFFLINQRCQHLTEDNKCMIQDHKPEVCRKYHGQKRAARGVRYYIPPGCSMR